MVEKITLKKKKITKSSSRKAKGRRLQNWLAQKISELIGLPYGPDQPIEPRQMGQNGVDVRLDNEARKLFPWSTECKNSEKWSLSETMKQVQANMYENTNWLIVLNKNRQKTPIVVLDAEVFFNLLKGNLKHEEKKEG
jgi:hypothetical protein